LANDGLDYAEVVEDFKGSRLDALAARSGVEGRRLVDHQAADAAAAQITGKGQAGWASTHDEDVDVVSWQRVHGGPFAVVVRIGCRAAIALAPSCTEDFVVSVPALSGAKVHNQDAERPHRPKTLAGTRGQLQGCRRDRAHAVLVRLPHLAAAGGALWVAYGPLELLQPWGPDTEYDEVRAYDVVIDPGLFRLYSLPGSLALLLCGVALLMLLRHLSVPSRAARAAGWAASALGAASAAGVATAWDPVFTGARVLGTVALGVGVLLAAPAAPPSWRIGLLGLGSLALFLMPLWPLVYALHWLSPGAGAAIFVAHGLGWIALGVACQRVSSSVTGSDSLSAGRRQ
jgi:hypothetical protein